MIKGVDLSHHNTSDTFNRLLQDDSVSFMILKSTEGADWTDPKFNVRAKLVTNRGKTLAAYHYLRFDNGYRDTEIKHCISTATNYTDKIFLDYEGNSLGHNDWLIKFCDTIKADYGIMPGIYCSLSVARSLGKIDYPIWIAHYNKDDIAAGNCVHYDGECCVQVSNSPYDIDYIVDKSKWDTAGSIDYRLTDRELMLINTVRNLYGK